jgi:hypothetical protein
LTATIAAPDHPPKDCLMVIKPQPVKETVIDRGTGLAATCEDLTDQINKWAGHGENSEMMPAIPTPMTVRRGLIRLCGVAAFVWLAYCGWHFRSHCAYRAGEYLFVAGKNPGYDGLWRPQIIHCNGGHVIYTLTEFIGIICGIVLAPIVISFVIIWIIRGFERDPS